VHIHRPLALARLHPHLVGLDICHKSTIVVELQGELPRTHPCCTGLGGAGEIESSARGHFLALHILHTRTISTIDVGHTADQFIRSKTVSKYLSDLCCKLQWTVCGVPTFKRGAMTGGVAAQSTNINIVLIDRNHLQAELREVV
jgi:hypothetical protein